MQLVQDPGGDARRRLKRAVEALVFAADEPVTPAQIADVFAAVTGEDAPSQQEVVAAVEALNESYRRTGRVFEIHAWGGGYRLATEAGMAPYVRALVADARPRRLSRSLLETLAVLAYRQPVTKPEVDFIRGVDSDYAIRKLLEHGFVDVVGRSETVGRPLVYGTTPRFLEHFGLASIEDLPTLREVEELLDDPAFSRERAELLALSRMGGGSEQPEGSRVDEPESPEPPAGPAAESEPHEP